MKTLKVQFVSQWEWTESGTGTITTDATLDLSTGILSIESSEENCDELITEYILYKNKKYSVEPNNENDYVVDKDDLMDIIFDMNS